MADVENLGAIDGVATAEKAEAEEPGWVSGLFAALMLLGISSFLAYLLLGTSLLHGTSKAVHALSALGFAVGIFLTLLSGTLVCADAVAICIFGDYEGKRQDQEGLPHVQP